MRLTVHHPAPYRHVPKGRRTPEDALVRIATPARLTVLGSGALERLPNQPTSAPELYVGDGAAWTRIALHPLLPGHHFHRKRAWLGPDAFAAWLGSPAAPGDGGPEAVSHAFRGTPLAAAWREPVAPRQGRLDHGWTERTSGGDPLPESARVLLDDRDRAAVDLQDFLDAQVRLTGDGVFLRSDLLVTTHGFGERLLLTSKRAPDPFNPPPLRPDQASYFTRFPNKASDDPRIARLVERLGPALLGDQDIRHHANALPVEADAVARLLSGRRGVPRMTDELAALALRGRIGGVRPAEAERAYAVSARWIREACLDPEARRGPWWDLDRILSRLAVVEDRILPRLKAGEVPPDDDARDLALLAP